MGSIMTAREGGTDVREGREGHIEGWKGGRLRGEGGKRETWKGMGNKKGGRKRSVERVDRKTEK